jgi:hypothetical protein
MISPSPTQQPPKAPTPEPKVVKATPIRKNLGQTPTALAAKAIFRPIFKGIYYFLQFIRKRVLLSIAALVLLAISISVSSYFATGAWPFGVGSDQFHFQVHGTNAGGDAVKNWLYALRNGDVNTLKLLDADMSQPPDPAQLVAQYGQSDSRTWKAITVIGVTSESDTTIDSFVEVDTSSTGPGGKVDGILIFHFITIVQGKEYLLQAAPISLRKTLG